MIARFRKFVLFAALPLLASSTEVAGQRCEGLSVQGELLWWKARGSNINYYSDFQATQYIADAGLDFASTTDTKFGRKSVHYHRNYGLRIGLQYRPPCSCYDALFNWTYFYTNASGAPDSCRGVDPLFSINSYTTDTKWKLNLNFWDLEGGRADWVCDNVALRGALGVRAATISQRFTSDCLSVMEVALSSREGPKTARQVLSIPLDSETEFRFREKHVFYGAGPRIALSGEIELGQCGISLFGDMAASFLVGFTRHCSCNHIALGLISNSSGGPTVVPTFSTDSTFDAMAPTLPASTRESLQEYAFERDEKLQGSRVITDFIGGLRWSPCATLCGRRAKFQIAWEHHTIFGQKRVYFGEDITPVTLSNALSEVEIPFQQGPCKSSLAVFGLTVSGSVEF